MEWGKRTQNGEMPQDAQGWILRRNVLLGGSGLRRLRFGVDEPSDLRFLSGSGVFVNDAPGGRLVELFVGSDGFRFQLIDGRCLVAADFEDGLQLFLQRFLGRAIAVAPLEILTQTLLRTFQMRHRLSFVIIENSVLMFSGNINLWPWQITGKFDSLRASKFGVAQKHPCIHLVRCVKMAGMDTRYSDADVLMSAITQTPKPKRVIYPETDGKPIAENTLQFRWIVTIQGGLDAQYADEPNVFVAGDLFWYPVEGENTIVQAPDIFVAFGRPKGFRGSYRQWEEGGIAPQVVFEILSPGNRAAEMIRKFQFYERHGVEEYYVFNPDTLQLDGWLRREGVLKEIPKMEGWTSPLLKVRFEFKDDDLLIVGANGRPFATYLELAAQREQAERDKAQAERDKAQALLQVEKLQAQLRALGVNPES
jgi:Uma2 family endonuclease